MSILRLSVIASLFTVLISWNAQALTFSESAATKSSKSIYGYLGFAEGGLGFGADYEYNIHRTYSVGAYGRIFKKDDNIGAPGVTALGAFVRPHFFIRTWDFYISPGFGVLMIDSLVKDETALGPCLNIGVLFQYSPEWAFGIENFNQYAWFSDNYRTKVLDVIMANFHYGFR